MSERLKSLRVEFPDPVQPSQWVKQAMSEKIEPALSAEEWARVSALDDRRKREAAGKILGPLSFPVDVTRCIALLNDALPGSDPRKITRAWVNAIRDRSEAAIADHVGAEVWEWVVELKRIADALESYLPPETT